MATPPTRDTDTLENFTAGTTASAKSAAASAAVRSTSEDVSDDAALAGADLETLRQDVIRLSKAVTALVSAQAVTAKETVTDKANELYDTGLGYVYTAEDQVRGMAEEVSTTVRRNPLASIGIVFGVGYVLGLIRRR